MSQNLTFFQFFHWYYSPEGNLWLHATEQAAKLAALGVSHVWLPPAYKSARGVHEPGYAVYDLYDLGEFDQKGTIPTRYGTKEQYLQCIESFHNNGVKVLADIVLNHKDGADEKEIVPVQQVNAENRQQYIGEPTEIEAYTKFYFPGRQGKYSEFVWDWQCFTGVDNANGEIFLIRNEYANGTWEDVAEEERGNFDYLMAADVEYRNPHVREELKRWAEWYINTTNVDGLRLDAVKHISFHYFKEWVDHVATIFNKDFFIMGEYWRNDVSHLLNYIEASEGKIQLFDVPLHFNFHQASLQGNEYDMRQIFDGSLLAVRPELAITFVDNHDTQPLQSLQSTVDYWFKQHAYALILLREQGIPCVFYPAVFEAKYTDTKEGEEIYIELNTIHCIEPMMKVRKHLAYGMQRDYFDHANTIGWTREGIEENEISGCAVIMTNGSEGNKTMEVGKRHAGKIFVDICGGRPEKISIDENGWADFFVNERSVSLWIREDALQIL